MSGYHDDSVPRSSGLIGHSLRMGAVVIAGGLLLVSFIGHDDAVLLSPAAETLSARQAPRPAAPVSELVLQAGPHGHFIVDAAVNGKTITFLVDTGASAIYLTPEDAKRLGWPPQRLTFSERYSSAAGEVRAAPVTLRTLRIGQLELFDLPASVGEQRSEISLLGMTFLKRLESYQVRGNRLILAW
ncbi:TIGR02281 family clan AA aspartic protease [Pelagibius sp. 7325]|uniref:retropepsin-like aspartic protease family protein n=1 Tax=Pelagibius sp. 7325 TaxID=3131994 RepID=UPI0030EB5818